MSEKSHYYKKLSAIGLTYLVISPPLSLSFRSLSQDQQRVPPSAFSPYARMQCMKIVSWIQSFAAYALLLSSFCVLLRRPGKCSDTRLKARLIHHNIPALFSDEF
jgi:hypothetical protein